MYVCAKYASKFTDFTCVEGCDVVLADAVYHDLYPVEGPLVPAGDPELQDVLAPYDEVEDCLLEASVL